MVVSLRGMYWYSWSCRWVVIWDAARADTCIVKLEKRASTFRWNRRTYCYSLMKRLAWRITCTRKRLTVACSNKYGNVLTAYVLVSQLLNQRDGNPAFINRSLDRLREGTDGRSPLLTGLFLPGVAPITDLYSDSYYSGKCCPRKEKNVKAHSSANYLLTMIKPKPLQTQVQTRYHQAPMGQDTTWANFLNGLGANS